MALPKIDSPIFTTKLISTGKEVKFRPFTVKEEIVINRKYNTTLWTAERNGRWVTPDTDVFNYDHTDLESGESNKERSEEYDKLDEKYKNENNI